MKVLVCGGRNFMNKPLVFQVLDELKPTTVINGGALGADAISSDWARERGVALVQFFAEWQRFGKAAGPMRNARMLAESRPQLVVAFRGGRGTGDMVRRATEFGIQVKRVL